MSLMLYSIAAFAAALGLYRLLQVGKRDPRMPKGPPTLPILGNFHQIPSSGLYRQFRVWAKEYGSVFSLKFGPSDIVVLCDREAIHELLDKKGSIYSDRPNTYVGQLLTKGDHIAIHQMDSMWREKRKVIAHNFSPKALDERHFRIQEAEATVLLNDLLRTPENFFDCIRRYTASVAATLVFGQRGATFESFWAHGVFDVMSKWTEAMEAGANPPVDEYPILKLLPKQICFWKRRAIQAGDAMDATWTRARSIVDNRRSKGDKRDCIVDHLLHEYNEKGFPMSQHAFNNLVGELVEGGADTTAAQLLTLVLALAKNPEVQRKARKEIDPLCGTERSPVWTDFKSLPYINAIVKEGMRWRPVAVTALPHRARQDGYYKGMLIPKDSTIFIPTWAIHHSEEIFEDHEAFNPDRFLNFPKLASEYAGSANWEERDNAHHYGYGAGRRVCPGMHLAERNMWRIASKLLWAFDIAEPLDPLTGKVVQLDTNAYNPGITQAPLPFKVRITPRSKAHAAAISKELNGALDFLSPFASKE
ncbi:Cytochrome P450 monooxygenase patI [Lachnellula cervina]|uniref:Cytochrome P450 monooxygenase patI n=1 Tax=Lachnellula cervina TaxID=1316786 RepID=A0A7D8UP52_9HELO|nr:Cytochrome P450 monooxygenase patI [Lachnellula cervina]